MKASSEKIGVGLLGESIACRFLEQNGYKILGRNYRKKWGEVDIVASKDDELHFCEVKTVTASTVEQINPADNLHEKKMGKFMRAVQSYLLEYKVGSEQKWHIDGVLVIVTRESHQADVEFLPDVS